MRRCICQIARNLPICAVSISVQLRKAWPGRDVCPGILGRASSSAAALTRLLFATPFQFLLSLCIVERSYPLLQSYGYLASMGRIILVEYSPCCSTNSAGFGASADKTMNGIGATPNVSRLEVLPSEVKPDGMEFRHTEIHISTAVAVNNLCIHETSCYICYHFKTNTR
jgi:hypothetical protein